MRGSNPQDRVNHYQSMHIIAKLGKIINKILLSFNNRPPINCKMKMAVELDRIN